MRDLLLAYEDERRRMEAFGRRGEVPERAMRAWYELLTRRESRVPQNLGGIRGIRATPLKFGAQVDLAPPTPREYPSARDLEEDLAMAGTGLSAAQILLLTS